MENEGKKCGSKKRKRMGKRAPPTDPPTTGKSTGKSTDRPTNRSTDKSTCRSTDSSTGRNRSVMAYSMYDSRLLSLTGLRIYPDLNNICSATYLSDNSSFAEQTGFKNRHIANSRSYQRNLCTEIFKVGDERFVGLFGKSAVSLLWKNRHPNSGLDWQPTSKYGTGQRFLKVWIISLFMVSFYDQ